jgi:dipeptidyl-peptidase-4
VAISQTVRSQGDSFPRQYARTRRFQLGEPRSFTVAPDGSRVLFLRSEHGEDPVQSLWVFDPSTGTERRVADPRTFGAEALSEVTPEERARRERVREAGEGIVSYAADREARTVAFQVGGRLFRTDLLTGETEALPAAERPFDPRPDPTGNRIAYVSGGALHVIDMATGLDRTLVEPDGEHVTWAMAEFVAAEDIGRSRGYWWAPDGAALAVARVDVSPVDSWFISDPANPAAPPVEVRYPAAGRPNADVSLWVIRLDGSKVEVSWDRGTFEYLVRVAWQEPGPLAALVQTRDQRRWLLLDVNPTTGATTVLRDDHDDPWIETVPGLPAWTDDGLPVFLKDDEGTRHLLIDDEPVTPEGLQVRRVEHVGSDVIVAGSEADPEEVHLWRVDGAARRVERLTTEPGIHAATAGGPVTVVVSETLDRVGSRATVLRSGELVGEVASNAARPIRHPEPRFHRVGPDLLSTALLLPEGYDPATGPLPVIVDPYGGPHAQRVLRAARAFLTSQWFADQGFAVLVTDGRGTPGRGPAWERRVHLALDSVLEDQVAALHTVAAERPELDLGRVGIRGWSFGGYLAAMAVLRRPDVFHAAVSGAPVTDLRLYDTYYQERYLGLPQERPDVYDRNSLIGDAPNLRRPLFFIHGLADDNVMVAHTLRLSRALLEAGRPHRVVLLSGITHMAKQEEVAENLLGLEVDFFREALAHPAELGDG